MGKYTQVNMLPDSPSDPRITDTSNPLRAPGRRPGQPLPRMSNAPDNFRNRTVVNTTPIQLVAGAAAVRVLPNNERRTGLIIQNKDTTADLFIGFGNAADANSFALKAGVSILLDFTCPAGEVYAFSASAIQAVFVEMSRGA